MSFPLQLEKQKKKKKSVTYMCWCLGHTGTYTHFIGAGCQLLNSTLKDGLNEKYWTVRQGGAPVKAALYILGARQGANNFTP